MKLTRAIFSIALGIGLLLSIPSEAIAADLYYKKCQSSTTYTGYTGDVPGSGSQTFSTSVHFLSTDIYGLQAPTITSGTTIESITTWCEPINAAKDPQVSLGCFSRLNSTTHSVAADHVDIAQKRHVTGGTDNNVGQTTWHETDTSCTNAAGYSSELDGDYVSTDGYYDLDWTASSISGATYTLERSVNVDFASFSVIYSGSNVSFAGQFTGSQIAAYFFRIRACDSSGFCSISNSHLVDNDLFEE